MPIGYLKEGENLLAVLVWYYGNEGRNNTDSGEAGFIFACEALNLYSDSSFLVALHPAYLYGGDNVGFNANLDFGDFTALDFEENGFEAAVEYENRVWGDCLESQLPFLYVAEKQDLKFIRTEAGAEGELPYAMTMSVCFELEAAGGEVIDIRTDRYCINGGPGDEHHTYNGHRIEYTAAKGRNVYECPMYLYSPTIIGLR